MEQGIYVLVKHSSRLATPIVPILKKKKSRRFRYGDRASAPSNPSRCTGCPTTTKLRFSFSAACSGRRQVATKLLLPPQVRLHAPKVEILLPHRHLLYTGSCLGCTEKACYARCTRFAASSPNGEQFGMARLHFCRLAHVARHNSWKSRKLPMQEDGKRQGARAGGCTPRRLLDVLTSTTGAVGCGTRRRSLRFALANQVYGSKLRDF